MAPVKRIPPGTVILRSTAKPQALARSALEWKDEGRDSGNGAQMTGGCNVSDAVIEGFGGSIGGLIAARVCHDHFDDVLIVEPETWLNSPDAMRVDPWNQESKRSRIVQYNSLHFLLAIGYKALSKLFPNIEEQSKGSGIRIGHYSFPQTIPLPGETLATGLWLRWYMKKLIVLAFTDDQLKVVISKILRRRHGVSRTNVFLPAIRPSAQAGRVMSKTAKLICGRLYAFLPTHHHSTLDTTSDVHSTNTKITKIATVLQAPVDTVRTMRMTITLSLPKDVACRLLRTLSFVVQEVERKGGSADDYKVLAGALYCGLDEHLNSDDEETLAGSSPLKSTVQTRERRQTSPLVSQDTPTPCPRVRRVHLIVRDPEEGPALKKSRRHYCLESDSVATEDEGSLEGLEGAGQTEDDLEYQEEDMDTAEADDEDVPDIDSMGDNEDNEDVGDNYVPGIRVAYARIPWECKRKGDKKRKVDSQRQPVQDEAANPKRPAGRGKKGKPNWTKARTLPPPTTNSLHLLTRLSLVSSQQEFMQAMQEITTQLSKPTTDSLKWDDMSLGAISQWCRTLEKCEGLHDYKLMLSYLQLMLTCDGREREAIWKGDKAPTVDQLADEVGATATIFRSWRSQGSRLLYLASAGRKAVVWKTSQDLHWYSAAQRLVKDLILPRLQNLLDLIPDAPWFRLSFWDDVNHCWTRRHFSDIVPIRDALDRSDVNFFYLPPPSDIWTDLTPVPMLDPQIDSYNIAPVHTIRTDFRIPINRCPFNTEEAPDWTAGERETARNAVPVSSLAELEDQLDGFYNEKGQKSDPDSYILIDTDICEGQTLIIKDVHSHPIAVVIPNMANNIPRVQRSIVPQLQATWPGQFVQDHSERPDYRYYSWHGSYYNRYSERGYDAPEGASPYYTLKEGCTTVHVQRRAPGHSREFLQDIGEADLLARLFQDVMLYVNEHIRKLLPEIYKDLTVFVNHLPLNDHSPAYPFSGFVVNVGVATDGHRDSFDKLPWDILIFPSGRITHFNLHFDGLRGSVVLHSDKGGDAWAQDEERGYNGWAHAVVK
ncbi:hypothetical protein EDD18DRAFT_1103064 [Armillaria luteobubalina]|uniref:Uncharacterized protein n=1 Tax=Armillaria luteobubalina TaxID=153913 RepID=A0AA39QDA2_9AGAR|nr:hypothetical protein EDD18DRAFT_1103064 [Armillaria luteobubalina]